MQILKPRILILAALVMGSFLGCSTASVESADVTANVRTALDQAGYRDVSITQDRSKGVVTLRGQVESDAQKANVGAIVNSHAGTQVVANEIAVVPVDGRRDAKQVNSDLDSGIESNLNAALITASLHDSVKYSVNNRVVTLTGDVNSPASRTRAGQVASEVPNVEQVVNAIQVKGQKATTQ
jgi:hyperosmotically inducible periplasmic protein